MGALVKYGTIAVGAYYAHLPGAHQPAFTDQYWPKWDRGGAKSPRTVKDKNRWYSLWSFGCRVSMGTGGASAGEPWYSTATKDLFEHYSCDGEGTQTTRFIRGTCVDASDVPVASAIVQAFATATDAFAGEVQANTDGVYSVPVNTVAGVQHYLVAYKPGSPDTAGTTVNTITSTNVDGT